MTCTCVTQWVIADQACLMYSMVTVALYDTLGPQAVAYVINLCELPSYYYTVYRLYFLIEKLFCYCHSWPFR